MKKLFAGLIATATAAVLAVPASATVVTTNVQTIAFGSHVTEFDPNSQSYASQAFQLFDSSLGTLLSVSLRATYQEASSISITNGGATTSTGSVNSQSILYVDAANTAQDAVFQDLLAPVTAIGTTANFGAPRSGTSGIAAGDTRQFTSNSGLVDTSYQTDSTASDLAAFAANGGGTGTGLASTYTTTNLNATGGNPTYTQTTTGTPTFYLYYTYDNSTAASVPEPATWAMMIAGFGFVGFSLRRKETALRFS